MADQDINAEPRPVAIDREVPGEKIGVSEKLNLDHVVPGDENVNPASKDTTDNGYGSETPDDEEPTEEEKVRLRRIAENLPMSAWLVAIVEFSERFTYYGCQGLFQNYIQRPLSGELGRGALGLGHQKATALGLAFSIWCYVTPIGGAIVADQYIGKYKAIVLFAAIYVVGILTLFLTSLPVALSHGAGLGGYIAAFFIIGIGTGGIKSNVAPLIADQYTRKKMAVKTLKSGERVIIDPSCTIQRIYLVFYVCINIGSLSLLATPYMERDVGFWSAYLLCFCVFLVGFVVLVLGRKFYVVRPPKGSIITDAFKAIFIMIRYRNLDAPKPSYKEEFGGNYDTPWDNLFIDELKRALVACRVFVFYPIYWVVYSQFSNNFVSQAGQMNGHGIPNDLMQNFDPISILFFAPIIDRIVYPFLQKKHIHFRPIARITLGFFISALSMAYAAILQHYIYKTGPCYGKPLDCPAGVLPDGTIQPNNIHIAIQTPAYLFIGVSEIFTSVTGLEYAYTKAPPSMKSFVQSLYLLTNAFGYAIGEAFTPLVGDPEILWLFVGLCAGTVGVGIIFWFLFHDLDKKEDEMNALDAKDEVLENKKALAEVDEGRTT